MCRQRSRVPPDLREDAKDALTRAINGDNTPPSRFRAASHLSSRTPAASLNCLTSAGIVSGRSSAAPSLGSMPAIFSVEAAIRPSELPKSGRSIIARRRPAIQKICICVKSAIRPNTATISNCILCDLCAIRSGSVCSRKNRMPNMTTASTRNRLMATMSTSVSPGLVMNDGTSWVAAG